MRSFCCCVNICFGRELQRKKYKTGRCGVVDWKYLISFGLFLCSIWKYWPKKRMNWSKNKRNRSRKMIGWAGGVVERWKGIFLYFFTEIAFLETVTLKGYFIGFLLLSRKHFPQTGVITNTKQRKRNEREGADGEWVGVGVGPPQQHLFNWRPPRLARAVVFRLTAAPRWLRSPHKSLSRLRSVETVLLISPVWLAPTRPSHLTVSSLSMGTFACFQTV